MRLSAAARPHRSLATLGMTVVLIQLFLAHRFFGFLTGDDVEVLEEAFRRAIGFPFSPWDIRSLSVPDFVVAPAVGCVEAGRQRYEAAHRKRHPAVHRAH